MILFCQKYSMFIFSLAVCVCVCVCVYVRKASEVTQSCPTLCDPMDCCLSCSSIRGIVQARILEGVAISFSRGSSPPGAQTWVSHIASRLHHLSYQGIPPPTHTHTHTHVCAHKCVCLCLYIHRKYSWLKCYGRYFCVVELQAIFYIFLFVPLGFCVVVFSIMAT